MPRIDITSVPARQGSGYPKPFDAPCSARTRRRLGEGRSRHRQHQQRAEAVAHG